MTVIGVDLVEQVVPKIPAEPAPRPFLWDYAQPIDPTSAVKKDLHDEG
jgi:hypothetical protein